MSGYDLARVVAGIVLGLCLASLPFLQYGARTHAHPAHATHAALATHDHAPHHLTP